MRLYSHLLLLLLLLRVGKLDYHWRGAALHGLRVVHGLDGGDGGLPRRECDEGAPLADAVVVPQHRALLDRPELVEHGPNVVLVVLLRHHAHEQLALWKNQEGEEMETIQDLFIFMQKKVP